MRVRAFRIKWAFALFLAAALAGCAGPGNRQAILDQLDPAPMTQQAWARVVGTYSGPVHSSTLRFGYEGISTRSIRLDISGTPYAPAVLLEEELNFSTSWEPYGERRAVFTNIPYKRYGTQGDVKTSTHAPNQLLLEVRRNGIPISSGDWVILTFDFHGSIEVDWVGHSGWRGEGELWRSPVLSRR